MGKLTTKQIRALPLTERLAYLNSAIAAAKTAAEAAIANMEDGGSCNFDAAVLPVRRGNIISQATPPVRAWTKKHGAYLLDGGYRGRGFHFHGGYQGATRTVWAETFRAVMEEHGVPMSMWYQVD